MATTADRYLERIRVCHRADLAAFVPWHAGGEPAGRLHRDRRELVLRPDSPFHASGDHLMLAGEHFAARSAAMAELIDRLVALGEIGVLTGEMYPVPGGLAPASLQLDRAAVPWFGVHACGVHVNGWVRGPTGPCMWVARRARGKRTFPGHLDNVVAGGQGIGVTATHTLAKECQEEAGIGPDLAARGRLASTLHYLQQEGRSLKVDSLACFDLELPAGFTPRPYDGEVEAFELWPLLDVAASLRGDGLWKANCALVALDFLLRHGALDRELPPAERQALSRALHGGG